MMAFLETQPKKRRKSDSLNRFVNVTITDLLFGSGGPNRCRPLTHKGHPLPPEDRRLGEHTTGFGRSKSDEVYVDPESLAWAQGINQHNNYALTCRRTILSEVTRDRPAILRGETSEDLSGEFARVYEPEWTNFARDWYDSYMTAGVVAVRLVRLPSGTVVPRVPVGDYRISVAVDVNLEKKDYRVYRWDAQKGCYRRDVGVFVLGNYGYDPGHDGGLHSPVSTLIEDVVVTVAQRWMYMKTVAKRMHGSQWVEDHDTTPKDVSSRIGPNYDPFSHPDAEYATSGFSDLNAEGRTRERRMRDTEVLMEKRKSEMVCSGLAHGKYGANEMIQNIIGTGDGAGTTKLLPPGAKIVQETLPEGDSHFEQLVRMVQEKICSTYGMNVEMMSYGGASRIGGNVEAVRTANETFTSNVKKVKSDLASTMTVLYNAIYEFDEKLLYVEARVQHPEVDSKDVFGRTMARLEFPKATCGEFALLTSMYQAGVVDWNEYADVARRQVDMVRDRVPPQPTEEELNNRKFGVGFEPREDGSDRRRGGAGRGGKKGDTGTNRGSDTAAPRQ